MNDHTVCKNTENTEKVEQKKWSLFREMVKRENDIRLINEMVEQENNIRLKNEMERESILYCDACDKCFKNERTFYYHFKKHYKNQTTVPFNCFMCDLTLKSKKDYRNHMIGFRHKRGETKYYTDVRACIIKADILIPDINEIISSYITHGKIW